MSVTIDDVISLRDGALRFIDQTALPQELRFIVTHDPAEVIDAVKRLQIRGAPLIGIAAAYGMYLASRVCREPAPRPGNTSTIGYEGAPLPSSCAASHDQHKNSSGAELPHNDTDMFRSQLFAWCDAFDAARPTAVNLGWAVRQCRAIIRSSASPETCVERLHDLAETIHRDEMDRCERIAETGGMVIPDGTNILTHCNTGMLATGGIGTALGVVLRAHRQRKRVRVYADETRPLLQGARLTTWECAQHGIPCTLITDSTAAFLMQQGKIDLVITGADRIAANGDTANKIGTYGLAVLAMHHGIPFYIAAPTSTIDPDLASGTEIPIEERSSDEVTHIGGLRIAADCEVYSPAFDVTPAALITGIITEYRILAPPFSETLAKLHT